MTSTQWSRYSLVFGSQPVPVGLKWSRSTWSSTQRSSTAPAVRVCSACSEPWLLRLGCASRGSNSSTQYESNVVTEHEEILAAIRAGDEALVKTLIDVHMTEAAERLTQAASAADIS